MLCLLSRFTCDIVVVLIIWLFIQHKEQFSVVDIWFIAA